MSINETSVDGMYLSIKCTSQRYELWTMWHRWSDWLQNEPFPFLGAKLGENNKKNYIVYYYFSNYRKCHSQNTWIQFKWGQWNVSLSTLWAKLLLQEAVTLSYYDRSQDCSAKNQTSGRAAKHWAWRSSYSPAYLGEEFFTEGKQNQDNPRRRW